MQTLRESSPFPMTVLNYMYFSIGIFILLIQEPFFFNLSEKFTHQCIYISTSNISYKMQFTYVVNFFESIKMGIHSLENLRLTYDFKLKGMVDGTMFILSNTCVFCRILFGQPFHN